MDNKINKNYETVSLILTEPKEIAIWLDEGRITEDDVNCAFEYIKEQNLLSKEDLKEKNSICGRNHWFL